MFNRGKVVWSPCELDYLKDNRKTRSVNELSLYLSKSRSAVQRKLDELDGKKVPSTNKKGTAIGKRNDILKDGKPCFFRSGWEANVARWLTSQGIEWKYEPEVFFFDGIKSGTVSYCPDFKYGENWLEVKGFLDARGKTAITRMKKYHPKEFAKLRAIVGSPNSSTDKFFRKMGVPVIAYMKDLNKQNKNVIPNWE